MLGVGQFQEEENKSLVLVFILSFPVFLGCLNRRRRRRRRRVYQEQYFPVRIHTYSSTEILSFFRRVTYRLVRPR